MMSLLAPKGIVGTCLCSAIVGFIYLLALLFAIPDVETFIADNDKAASPINLAVATYRLAVPHRGAMALTIILILNVYFAGMSSLTVTSRIGYTSTVDSCQRFKRMSSLGLRWRVMVSFQARPVYVGSIKERKLRWLM
jgi:amino acid transporter